MAEAAAASTAASPVTVGWTKHVTCRYFMHGLCKEGDHCRYSHDLTNSQPAAMTCKFFQKGNCVFGDRCRFEHCKPEKTEEELPTSQALPLPSVSKAGSSDPEPSGPTPGSGAQDWVNAAEFVPGQPYCGRAETPEGLGPLIEESDGEASPDKKELRKQLCPYAAVGECRYGINCAYLHGNVCDLCGLQVLHPTDNAQHSAHTKVCIEAHEKDMEISFAIQRSKDMMCGVCMEVVFEKANPSERRFGILSNCSHCYCLKCIRKWRTKACRYFDEGRGTCPFGSNCFYKHVFPDGRLEDTQPQRRQTGSNSRNRSSRRTPLWDIFDERESTDSFDNEDEELVTFELSEMLLMLLAAGTDDEVTDSEDEWDLFHEELDDFYEIYL
ncbi:probable E3 ubiquitin-protein ligase makorin-1 isoform X2 [Pseudoliparis swirei]|uniref:probable E3 ubiquitin-protein ligase makorin-1 isoform X2 n=1 Tax=Pseudoliparis swirei TaxID=2059687 RepID=UPI0024BDD7B7|nr:probable E3 ubiquitin-protein ligase makorin-1 isoform X2 [Pseudoliparis swirei]